jgi:ubiquinone/menaquinone biosynthesis C-methylase UbiE
VDRLLDLTGRAEATHFWFRGFRRFVTPVLADIAGGRRDLRILDCGCGTGHNLMLLRPYGHGMGFDLSSGGLVLARARVDALAQANIAHIPFATGSFDLVTCFDVMQCVPEDREAVREVARVARPGGSVVLTMAAFNLLRGDHAEVWGEVRRYTRSTARALVEQSGLRVERISYHFASTLPLMLVVRLAQRWLRPYRGLRDDSDIAVPSPPVNALLTGVLSAEGAVSRVVPMPFGSSLLVVARKP